MNLIGLYRKRNLDIITKVCHEKLSIKIIPKAASSCYLSFRGSNITGWRPEARLDILFPCVGHAKGAGDETVGNVPCPGTVTAPVLCLSSSPVRLVSVRLRETTAETTRQEPAKHDRRYPRYPRGRTAN